MFANHSADQQPDRQAPDPLLTIFSREDLDLLESKPLNISASLEQLRVCCQLGMIPEEARKHTQQIALDIFYHNKRHLNVFIESVVTLANWEGVRENERWLGLARLSQLKFCTSLYPEAFTALLDACSGAERPEIVGFAYRCLHPIKSHQWASAYLEFMEHAKEITSYPKNTRHADYGREISLLAVHRALGEHSVITKIYSMVTGSTTLDAFKRALESEYYTEEGQRARIGVLGLDASFHPTKIASELTLIAKAEKQIHSLKRGSYDLSCLYHMEYRDNFVNALERLPLMAEKRMLAELITQASQTSKAALDVLKIGLGHNRRHAALINYIREINSNVAQGLRLESSILIVTHLQEGVDKINEIFDNAYESRDLFYQLIPAIEKFLDRAKLRMNQGRMACFQEIVNRLTSSQTLEFPETFRKLVLILSGTGVTPSNSIHTMEKLSLAITELSSKSELSMLMRGSHGDKIDFARRFKIDNPPFSLEREPYENQVQFQREVNSIMRRAPDGHYGFWANTYFFMHTPISRRCDHDEMAMAVNADLYAIPCKDAGRFPGRGRIIENIDSDRVFSDHFTEEYWRNVVFPSLGPIAGATEKGNCHAIDNLLRQRITSCRGLDGVEIPSNKFTRICGESMTLIHWNHHGDACSPYEVSLVPARAFNSFFERLKVPYNPFSDEYPSAEFGDIADEPPTVDAIQRRCIEMGLPIGVLNITSGSCFSGGLCNGAFPKSHHFHKWEQRSPHATTYYDAFDHVHKYHIQYDPAVEKSLRDLHRRAYEVATALFNARDIYKYMVGFYARGHIQRHGQNPHDQRLEAYPVKYGAQKLQLFCDFTEEFHLKGARNQAPVLILAPMNKWAAMPDTPIVLDGSRRYVFQLWGKPFEFEINNGIPSDNLIEWWQTHVDTALEEQENIWDAPRLVAADNYQDLMKEYGGMDARKRNN